MERKHTIAEDTRAAAWARHGLDSTDKIIEFEDWLITMCGTYPAVAEPSAVQTVTAGGRPGAQFVEELVEALVRLPWPATLKCLRELDEFGVYRLRVRERELIDAVLRGRAGAAAADSATGAVRAYLSLLATRCEPQRPLDPDDWQALVGHATRAIVDDLIDGGNRLPDAILTTLPAQDAAYLRARSTPAACTDQDVNSLQWEGEARRRALLRGDPVAPSSTDRLDLLAALRAGKTDVLAEMSGLAGEYGEVARTLIGYRDSGALAPHIAADESLWPVLEQLRPADPRARPRWTAERWIYLRAALRKVEAAHRTYGSPREQLGHAEALCGRVLSKKDTGKERLSPQAEAIRDEARHLIAFIQRMRKLGDRALVLHGNPYLILGVPHGSSEWESAWREAFRSGDEERQIRANTSHDRLRNLDLANDIPAIPKNRDAVSVPEPGSGLLAPAPEPLARRTEPSPEDYAALRAAAAHELIHTVTASVVYGRA